MRGWLSEQSDNSCWPVGPVGAVTTFTATIDDFEKGKLIISRSRRLLLDWLAKLPDRDRREAVEGESWMNMTLWHTVQHRDFADCLQ